MGSVETIEGGWPRGFKGLSQRMWRQTAVFGKLTRGKAVAQRDLKGFLSLAPANNFSFVPLEMPKVSPKSCQLAERVRTSP